MVVGDCRRWQGAPNILTPAAGQVVMFFTRLGKPGGGPGLGAVLRPVVDVFRHRHCGESWMWGCRSSCLGLEFRGEIVAEDIKLRLLANT